MDVIYTRAQARALFLVKSTHTVQLQKTLSVAFARISRINPEELTDAEKKEGLGKLTIAIAIMRQPHHKNDLATRTLFKYTRENIRAVDSFVQNEKFSTLRKIVDVAFEEIELALSEVRLDVPIALRTFYEVYHELKSERNLQSA